MAFTKALEDISAINSNAKVLVLGRNRRDIDAFICKEIQVQLEENFARCGQKMVFGRTLWVAVRTDSQRTL